MRTEGESGGGAAVRRALDAARTEARTGSVAQAWQLCRVAALLARLSDDVEGVAAAATILVEPSIGWKNASARQALCLEALGLLGTTEVAGEPPSHAEWRTLVRGRLDALSTGWADRLLPASAVDARTAEREFAAMVAAHEAALGGAGLTDRLAIALDAIRLGRAASDDLILAWGLHWHADELRLLGLWVEFSRCIGELAANASAPTRRSGAGG